MTTELLASLAEALGSRYDDEEEADFPRLRRAANTLAASVGSHTELGQLLAIAADAAVRRQRGQRARDKTATDDTSGQMDE
jgi:hypothetical protein